MNTLTSLLACASAAMLLVACGGGSSSSSSDDSGSGSNQGEAADTYVGNWRTVSEIGAAGNGVWALLNEIGSDGHETLWLGSDGEGLARYRDLVGRNLRLGIKVESTRAAAGRA